MERGRLVGGLLVDSIGGSVIFLVGRAVGLFDGKLVGGSVVGDWLGLRVGEEETGESVILTKDARSTLKKQSSPLSQSP